MVLPKYSSLSISFSVQGLLDHQVRTPLRTSLAGILCRLEKRARTQLRSMHTTVLARLRLVVSAHFSYTFHTLPAHFPQERLRESLAERVAAELEEPSEDPDYRVSKLLVISSRCREQWKWERVGL